MRRTNRIFGWLTGCFLRFVPEQDRDSFAAGLEEACRKSTCSKSSRENFWLLSQLVKSLPSFIGTSFRSGWNLTLHNCKMILRSGLRHKLFSLIHIVGLGSAMACFLLILVYVVRETHMDRYHEDYTRIYRAGQTLNAAQGAADYAASAPPLGPALREFPEVESSARILYFESTRLVRRGDRAFYESGFAYADQDLFRVLTFRFLLGDPERCLGRPGTVVLPARLTEKYFGGENPLGQTLNLDGRDFMVTGVIEDARQDTHLPLDLFVAMEDLRNPAWMSDWTWPGMYTYIKLRPGVSEAAFRDRLASFQETHLRNQGAAAGQETSFFIQPIASIHLSEPLVYDIVETGNRLYVAVFSVTGILILMIAGVNFIHLTTARAGIRLKEIGLRRVVGATRTQLEFQFLGETLAFVGSALLFGAALAYLILPFFQSIAVPATWRSFFAPKVLAGTAVMALGLSLFAGIFPARMLSSMLPSNWTAGSSHAGRGRFRKLLVTVQFTITIFILIFTLGISHQVRSMKDQDPGFGVDRRFVIPVRGRAPLFTNLEAVKAEFLKLSHVLAVTASGNTPGSFDGQLRTRLSGETYGMEKMMYYSFVDADFIPVMDLGLAVGRNFRKQGRDGLDACLINEAAARAFGFSGPEQALGRRIVTGLRGLEKEIIGVVDDFYFRELKHAVEPMVLEVDPAMFQSLCLELDDADPAEMIPEIESAWRSLYPDRPFEGSFLSQTFEFRYGQEERAFRLLSAFTAMGIGIACLGLLGLASFFAQNRMKEIGIRKVLGARAAGLAAMLMGDLLRWVLLANVIAWPMAYVGLKFWVRQYAFQALPGVGMYAAAAGAVILIAGFTVCFQALKGARMNPVKVIRVE